MVKELAYARRMNVAPTVFIIDAGWYSEKVKSGKGWMQSSGGLFCG
ncbi:MAG: hypothetical protein AB2L24_03265 [Mangrovibacterium sp.]